MSAVANLHLAELLGQLDPISVLPPQRREEIMPLCTRECLSPRDGEINFSKWPRQLVYLVSGEMKLGFPDGSVQVVVGGSRAAHSPLGSGTIMAKTCKPITDVELVRVDEDVLDLVLAWYQSSDPKSLKESDNSEMTDWRMMSGMFAVQNLARSAFASLPAANIERLLERFERNAVKKGQVIVREGDDGDYYYLIESGRCQVTRRVGGVEMDIANLKPGDAFGEEALLADAARNATVAMKTDGALLRLSKADFFELLTEPLLNRISLQEARRRVVKGAQWIDVRYPAEFVHDGQPGAINIPLNELRRSMTQLDTKREYVAYCHSGRRSSAAAFLLSQRGINASMLEGGLKACTTDVLEKNTQ